MTAHNCGKANLRRFFVENIGEELTVQQMCDKFDVTVDTAYKVMQGLAREGRAVRVTVYRSQAPTLRFKVNT